MNAKTITADLTLGGRSSPARNLVRALLRMGVLPGLMLVAVLVFSVGSDGFMTEQNAVTVTRQASYLVLVAIAQYLVIVTGGLDLSVGVVFSICSVVSAGIMASHPEFHSLGVWYAIALASAAGLLAGCLVGVVNGIGVAYFHVPPFMMTLAMSSVGFGVALMITGGTPIYGLPHQFSEALGFGTFFGVPAPVAVTALLVGLVYVFLHHMPAGRYLFAIGSNARASELSGIDVRLHTFLAYVFCSTLAAVSALLLTARLETGEANLGASMPLQSIAACVVGGVSLSGGKGRLRDVVLGAVLITLLQNGMNLLRMDSYVQMIVIGVLLVGAIVVENVRSRYELAL